MDLARSLAGEHLAPVVHHAGLGRRPHRAAAERVDADQLVLQQLRPYRVLQVGPSQRCGRFSHHVLDPAEHGLFADARPPDAQPVLFQHQAAARVVVGHDQVSQRMAKSPVVGAPSEALDLAGRSLQAVGRGVVLVPLKDGGGRGKELGRGGAECPGDHALFDDDPLVELGAGTEVDQAGDGGADGRLPVVRVPAGPADAVDLGVPVVTEGEDVAVAGEALAQPGGERQPAGSGAEQDLGAAERSRPQDDDAGLHRRAAHHVPVGVVQEVEVDPPTTGGGLHPPDQGAGENPGTVVDGVGQVVHQRRVLGPVVAACDAVPAGGATGLPYPGIVVALLESDVDAGAPGYGARPASGAGKRCQLGKVSEPFGTGLGRNIPNAFPYPSSRPLSRSSRSWAGQQGSSKTLRSA